MKKGDFIKAFLSQNNITVADKQTYNAFLQANPGFDCSFVYFQNVAKGPRSNEGSTAERLGLVGPFMRVVPQEITPAEPIVYETKRAADINFSDDILVPVKTGKVVDELISYAGGIMPATVVMIPGGSGVGKTTLMLELLGGIKKADPTKKVLFVSSEMNSIHIFKYKKRINFDELDVCLLSESETPWQELKATLQKGWDIVLLDSLADTINKIRCQMDFSEKVAEKEMLSLMDNIRRGNNEEGKYTTFLCTQHMTKGNVYAGSSNLKHMTDAMMELHQCENDENKKFIIFSKNRDGKTLIKLYYSIVHTGIEFDVERFVADQEVRVKIARSTEIMKEKQSAFEKLFNIGDGNDGDDDNIDNENLDNEDVFTDVVAEEIFDIENDVPSLIAISQE